MTEFINAHAPINKSRCTLEPKIEHISTAKKKILYTYILESKTSYQESTYKLYALLWAIHSLVSYNVEVKHNEL